MKEFISNIKLKIRRVFYQIWEEFNKINFNRFVISKLFFKTCVNKKVFTMSMIKSNENDRITEFKALYLKKPSYPKPFETKLINEELKETEDKFCSYLG